MKSEEAIAAFRAFCAQERLTLATPNALILRRAP